MINRVSSASIFKQGVATMLNQQSQIARTQLELSSGRRIITAKDDPLGASIALAMDRGLAELSRWKENSTLVQNRLQREEVALTQVGDRLQRLRELAVQANNGVHDAQTLRGLVLEMEQIREGMLQLANTTDGTGRYLFGGSIDATPPFIRTAAGVVYNGDQTQRRIEIGPDLMVADADPGSEIFQRIRTGNGVFTALQDPANAGSLMLTSAGFTDTAAWDGRSYRIEFSEPDPVGAPGEFAYRIIDGNGGPVVPPDLLDPPIPYVPGEAIEFSGVQITLSGTPADGDAFTVEPSPNQDIFRTIDQLIAAVKAPSNNPSETAVRQNGFWSAIENLSQAGDWVIDKRAGIGARLHTIDRTDEQRMAEDENFRATLSKIRDTDFAEAISRLSFQLQSLEAAQNSFVRVQNLSLFNFLR
jgi:flagellar hook-associated protein 3 FlgL